MENKGLATVPVLSEIQWSCATLVAILRDCGPCYLRRGFVKNRVLEGGYALVSVGANSLSKFGSKKNQCII